MRAATRPASLHLHPATPTRTLCAMKLATLNINNVRRRLPNLLAWLSAAQPDIVCLQELKTTDAEFPVAEIKRAGYHAAWRGQKTWNGVAILGRARVPVVTRTELPGDPDDTQSRYIEAAVDGIIIACVYCRTATRSPDPSSTTSSHGSSDSHATPPRCATPGCRWHCSAISTWCRRKPTSIRPVVGQRRTAPAGKPGRVPALMQAGLDRCGPHAPSRCAHVYLLGLQAPALGTRRRPSARLHPARSRSRATSRRRGRRSRSARRAERE